MCPSINFDTKSNGQKRKSLSCRIGRYNYDDRRLYGNLIDAVVEDRTLVSKFID